MKIQKEKKITECEGIKANEKKTTRKESRKKN